MRKEYFLTALWVTVIFLLYCMVAGCEAGSDQIPTPAYKPSPVISNMLKGEDGKNTDDDDSGGSDDDNDDNDSDEEGDTVERLYTFRAISGISMGSTQGFTIGAVHHDLFDIIGGLGGPSDLLYTFHMIERQHLSGFCEMEEIIADPTAYCGPIPHEQEWEWDQDFNNWQYSDSGGNFDRDEYAEIFEDLSLGLGNLILETDGNHYLPRGLPAEWVELSDEERCANPYVVSNFFNHKYNPEGTFNAVTFCDGADHVGVYDPDEEHKSPIAIMLAIDYNGNNKRDYGEPVITGSRELWDDFGCDGVPGGEDEYLPRDNPDQPGYLNNPEGTDNNWKWDECETFYDYGLDGVPGTGDYGEDDGVYTMSLSWENALAHDARTLMQTWSDEEFARIDWYFDAGIRDLFNFAVSMDQIAAYINWRGGNLAVISDFTSLKREGDRDYDFRKINFDDFGKSMYVRYGKPDATPEEIDDGDGAHVGTPAQAVFRFNTYFAFLSARWPEGNYERVDSSLKGLTLNTKFYSKSLGTERKVTILLPPGYNDEKYKDTYYPVVYFGHGYGMDPEDLSATFAIFSNYMKIGYIQKMIIVYTDGQCCFMNHDTEEINCLGYDAEGNDIENQPGWKRMCHRGNFYLNQFGRKSEKYPLMKYKDSILDLIEFMDANYRTKASLGPKRVPVPKDTGYSPDERPRQRESGG
ncbi:MAG: hypothetical protein Kow0090_07360 [Myxococcota bacterium]